MRKISAEEKSLFVMIHKFACTMGDPGLAAQTMLGSLSKFLHDDLMSPEDAADILRELYDPAADAAVLRHMAMNGIDISKLLN